MTSPREVLEQQQWLDSVSDVLGDTVQGTFEAAGPVGVPLKNFLHGTWLGHPLHAVLTDIPLGAWSAAQVFDILGASAGEKTFDDAADALIGVGLAGAAGAALAGLTDWSETDGSARKLGLIHGLLNVSATVLFTASLLSRKGGARGSGRSLATIGYLLAAGSAYLGGQLVYGEKIGVDRAPRENLPRDFKPVLAEADLPEDTPVRTRCDDVSIVLVRRGKTIHALAETCSHLGGPLADGELEDDTIRCPWHGSCFRLQDGAVVEGPAVHRQPVLEVRVNRGQIEVRKKME